MFNNISYDILYVKTIFNPASSAPKRLKINGLIAQDSGELPASWSPSLFRDTSQTLGGLETRSIPVKSRTAWKLKSPTPQTVPDYLRCWAHTPQ